MERRDRGCRLNIRGHLHETKSTRLSCELVCDDLHRGHRAMRPECVIQLLLGRRIRQPTDVKL